MSFELLATVATLAGLLLWKRKMDIITIFIGAVAVLGGCGFFTYTILVEHCKYLTLVQTLGISGITALLFTVVLIAIAEQF